MKKKRGKQRVKSPKQTKRVGPPVNEKWAQKAIKKAEQVVKKHIKKPHIRKRHHIVFWISVITIILLNILIAFIIIPLLAAFNVLFFDAIVVLIGFIIGILYTFLLVDIAHLEKHHHTLAATIIPLIVIINIIIIGALGQEWSGVITRPLWGIAAVYGGAFILPYIFDRLR